ncbi:xanthine dehydrogenase small subunit [Flocculibacter collagenilyticus]|uniref:xanthine dehydrogenase small subunit n=1 Tax=Flocculibacter collagenilyticus TaxID=2744479 RepID=UPI0018F5BDE2|nr:xanthine dehydrogenase small subunit [Flocculibacter collagenilyticus]
MIEFLLNTTKITIERCDPNLTVLRYLREHHQLMGTKEGCGSGDCGACTVVVAQLSANEKLTYKTINSCITLVSHLHGKQLITVEHLENNNKLHPVQQAMVENHGSQCGFCTPGIVMSLFALKKNIRTASKQQIEHALSGNLCRCTGYVPIIAAARLNNGITIKDQFSKNATNTILELKQIATNINNTPTIKLERSQCYLPQTLAEATALLQQSPKARIIAGGTDLSLEITQQYKQFKTLVNLSQVKELSSIDSEGDALIIGASCTLAQCTKLLRKFYPSISEMLERFGSSQIRNQATMAGSIANASPIGDLAPILITLNAHLTLQSANSTRQISVESFFVDYKKTELTEGELISYITIPKPQKGYQLKVYKISKRPDDDISAVLAAFYYSIKDKKIDDIHIAYGGMAATPKRATHCEQALKQQAWKQASIDNGKTALLDDFEPISDVRASKQYRMTIAQNLLQKCFYEHSSRGLSLQVSDYA